LDEKRERLQQLSYDAQMRPVLNRRLPLPRQILEAVRLEQRLVELASLKVALSESGG
jgi:hypothetical protein